MSFTARFRANDMTILAAPNHIKAKAGARLGSLTLEGEGGTGAVTVSVKEKPDWDDRPDSEILNLNVAVWSIIPHLPPVVSVKSKYVFELTDSATPNPNKVDYTLYVEQAVPDGFTFIDTSENIQSLLIEDAVWLILDHGSMMLGNRNQHTNRSVDWYIRKHSSNHKLLCVFSFTYTSSGKINKGRHFKVFDKPITNHDVCAVFERDCTPAEATSIWEAIKDHFPPYTIV